MTVVINHLPVVLNQLCWLLIRVNNEEVSVNVLKVLVHIVNEVHEANKAAILDSYLHYVFLTPTLPDVSNKATFHEEMVKKNYKVKITLRFNTIYFFLFFR